MTKAPVSTTEARKLLNLNKSRRGKYNANGQKIDGHWFASAAEAKRYVQLKDMQQDDLIEDLVLQPSYPIVHHGKPITTYRADFRYVVLNELKRVFYQNSS